MQQEEAADSSELQPSHSASQRGGLGDEDIAEGRARLMDASGESSAAGRRSSRALEAAETEVLYHKKKPAAPKRRSASIQRKSVTSLPVIHQVPCTDFSAIRRREKRRSVAEMIGLFRRSGADDRHRHSERSRSLEDIRRESSTAWILSASHVDTPSRGNRRNSVSVVLSEMTARDILTDNMLENRMQEIRETNSNQFSSVSEMEVFLNSSGVNTREWREDRQKALFELFSLIKTNNYRLKDGTGGNNVELVTSTVQVRLVNGKSWMGTGRVLQILKRETENREVLTDELHRFPELQKAFGASIETIAKDYVMQQLGLEHDEIEIVEGGTVRVIDTVESDRFPGVHETKERYVIEVSTKRLLNRGHPFRTQLLGIGEDVEQTITWAWRAERFLDEEVLSDGEHALRDWLTARGVDVREWGKNGNKSVYQLLVELLSGNCRLYDSCPPFRQCAFVNTRIWNEDRTKVLLETAEKPKRGRPEVKNYYLSQKVAINDLHKDPNYSVDDVVSDSIIEKLFNEETSEIDRIQPFSAGSLEHWGQFCISFESPSFPTLPSQYTVLTTDVIVEGLPQDTSFETVEYDEDDFGNQTGEIKSRHFWTWQTVDLTNHRISSKLFDDYADELSNDPAIFHSNSSFTHQGTPLSRNTTFVANTPTGGTSANDSGSSDTASHANDNASTNDGFTPRSSSDRYPGSSLSLEAAGTFGGGMRSSRDNQLSPLGLNSHATAIDSFNAMGSGSGGPSGSVSRDGDRGYDRGSIASRSQASFTSDDTDHADGGDLESLRDRDEELEGMIEDDSVTTAGLKEDHRPRPESNADASASSGVRRREGDGSDCTKNETRTVMQRVTSESEGLNAVVSMASGSSSGSLGDSVKATS